MGSLPCDMGHKELVWVLGGPRLWPDDWPFGLMAFDPTHVWCAHILCGGDPAKMLDLLTAQRGNAGEYLRDALWQRDRGTYDDMEPDDPETAHDLYINNILELQDAHDDYDTFLQAQIHHAEYGCKVFEKYYP